MSTIVHAPYAAPVRLRVWAPESFVFAAAGFYSIFAGVLPGPLQQLLPGGTGLFLLVMACLPQVRAGFAQISVGSMALFAWLLVAAFAYMFVIVRPDGLSEYATTALRAMTSIGALVYFMQTRSPVLPRIKILIAILAVTTAIVMTARYGPYLYGGAFRPQPFSGDATVHPTGYVFAALLAAIVLMRRGGEIGRFTAWLVGLPVFAMVVAYQVRTTWVMLAVFFAVLAANALARRLDRRIFAALSGSSVALAVCLITVSLFLVLPALDLQAFSSGRTETYAERIALIAGRSGVDLFFGTGIGTDSFYSDAWWWERMDSHNDFLTIVIEQGLIGLALLMTVIVWAFRHATPVQVAILLSLVTGSAISNGLLDRPTMAVMYLALLAPTAGGSVGRDGRR